MNLPFQHLLPTRASGYIFLGLLWLLTGFALGVAVLLWPLRIWVNYVRDNAYSDIIEKAGVVMMIILLAVVSFRISLFLFQWHLNQERTIVTIYAFCIPLVFAALALYLMMKPQLVNRNTAQTTISQKFTTGPYPTADKIQQLKADGFTGIIALLHPAVMPFEPELLQQEETALKNSGIELIKAPMLPWIGDNSASLQKIEDIIKNGKGKYYIHCYLGKDRVNVVKNLIVRLSGTEAVHEINKHSSRTFEQMGAFERGDIYRLDSGVYMTPFPTDEEFLSFFLAGKVKSVINMMDTPDEESRQRMQDEQKTLEQAGLQFRHMPVVKTTGSSLANITDTIARLPKPLVIHHWGTDASIAKIFRQHYRRITSQPAINLSTHNAEAD
ncbi:hypothetical protein [Foetidibacter luteolus]|uniref:hypothetical protein n=1 Tax=Foetidibacter luteolus TaxID=2608880 RepID=UPI00129C0E03|nr:hypothetical protein [Foetidibacter luteolus]